MGLPGSKPLKIEEGVQPRTRVIFLEYLVIVSIFGMILSLVPKSLGWPFPDHFVLGSAAIIAGIMSVAAPSRTSRDVLAVLAAILGGVVVWWVLGVHPLRTTLHAARFRNVTMAEILQAIVRQDRGHLEWHFQVLGERIAKQKLTIEIPEGATTRATLDRIARATRCTYQWRWKTLGCVVPVEAYSVQFEFRPDDPGAVPEENVVYIERNSIGTVEGLVEWVESSETHRIGRIAGP